LLETTVNVTKHVGNIPSEELFPILSVGFSCCSTSAAWWWWWCWFPLTAKAHANNVTQLLTHTQYNNTNQHWW